MAIVEKSVLFERVRKRFENDTDDETLSLIEDLVDTVNSYDGTDWKNKFEENDKNWRNKFKEKFFNSAIKEKDSEEESEKTEPDKPEILTYDQLFKEEK